MLKKNCIFAVQNNDGSVAQLNRVSDYGSEGYRFESCRNHIIAMVAELVDAPVSKTGEVILVPVRPRPVVQRGLKINCF